MDYLFNLSILQLTLIIGFLLILISFRTIARCFVNINKITWVFLFIIFLSGFLFRVFFSPRLFLRTGEHGYKMVSSILEEDYGSLALLNSTYGSGYSDFYLLILKILPNDISIFFAITLGVSSISVFLMFILGYLLSESEIVGLYSAFLFAIHPVTLRFATSDNMYVLVLFFELLSLTNFLTFFKTNNYFLYFSSILLLNFLVQIRPDFAIFPIVPFLLFIFCDKDKMKKIKDYRIYLGINLFAVLVYLPLAKVYQSQIVGNPLASNIKISLQEFFLNPFYPSASNFIFNLKYNPIIFSILFILGTLFLLKKKISLFIVLLFSFMIFHNMFLKIIHGDIALSIIMGIGYILFYILICSFGIEMIIKISKFKYLRQIVNLILAMIFTLIPFIYKHSVTEAFSPQKEYLFIKENRNFLPSDCLYVMAGEEKEMRDKVMQRWFPTFLFNKGHNILTPMSIDDLFNNTEQIGKNCVIYFQRLICYRFHFFDEANNRNEIRPACKKVTEKFNLIPIKEITFKSDVYSHEHFFLVDKIKLGFYWVREKNDSKK